MSKCNERNKKLQSSIAPQRLIFQQVNSENNRPESISVNKIDVGKYEKEVDEVTKQRTQIIRELQETRKNPEFKVTIENFLRTYHQLKDGETVKVESPFGQLTLKRENGENQFFDENNQETTFPEWLETKKNLKSQSE